MEKQNKDTGLLRVWRNFTHSESWPRGIHSKPSDTSAVAQASSSIDFSVRPFQPATEPDRHVWRQLKCFFKTQNQRILKDKHHKYLQLCLSTKRLTITNWHSAKKSLKDSDIFEISSKSGKICKTQTFFKHWLLITALELMNRLQNCF